ncbi:MAG: dipeptidase [Pseudoxanthomonas suwonensis]|nr:dipeptidase [Pseudoxanthomonas suwonensis]
MRKTLLFTALALGIASGPLLAQATDAARALAQDAIIVDTHIDAPGMLMDGWLDLGDDAPGREFDWPKARAGGLDVAWMSIYTSAGDDASGAAWDVANRQIDAVRALASQHPDKFGLMLSPREVQAREGGRVLLPMGMENGAPLGDDLSRVAFFFERGIRYITFSHSASNRLSDASYGVERKWNGLSPFGREVIAEMNRLGMMVDVSHLSDQAAMQAIEASTVPVIVSHSAFRHFTPGFERNISDEVAKAVAARGGVIQIPFGTAFVNPAAAANMQTKFREREAIRQRNERAEAEGRPLEDIAAFNRAFDAANPTPQTPLSAVIEQIEYGRELVGIDHIGLGSDFDGVGGELADGLRTVADFPNLIAALQARGWSESDLRKLLGGNFLRTWTAIEDGARR